MKNKPNLFIGLIQACHFGPTLAVTLVSYLLATNLWWEGPAFVIAIGVLLGQLLVGFTNDLNDYEDDLKHKRVEKPLVSGVITNRQLKRAIFLVAPLAVMLNLFGPLGLKGGSLYLLGVGLGVSYNFYFKTTLLSPLPYALAFASLVSSVVISTDQNVPIWLVLSGALFGVAAHFANVLKDLDQDLTSGIKGLPQRLRKKKSRIICGLLLITLTLTLNNANPNPLLLIVGLFGALLTASSSDKWIFKALMITAIVDVILLLEAAGTQIGSITV
ncbi:MAG: UbiA family prenyltransferase [Candidatus Nanopelagicus sp.]